MSSSGSVIALVVVLIIGAVLLDLARWSRRRWEEAHGQATAREKLRASGIFLLWCLALVAMAWYRPEIYAVVFIILILGFLPVGRSGRGVTKDILDMGFLAVLIVAPFALIWYTGQN